jgi:hypothetical protein
MLEGLKASDETAKSYYKTGLVEYEEPVTKPGPEGKDETQFTPKSGWFSMPVGTRFKVDPDDSKSEMGMVTEVSSNISTNDVTGKETGSSKATKVKLEDGSEYTVNDEGEEDEVTLLPWSKQPVKKNGKGGKGKGGKKIDKPAKKADRSGGRRL